MKTVSTISPSRTLPSLRGQTLPAQGADVPPHEELVPLGWRDAAACLLLTAVLGVAAWIHSDSLVCGEYHDDAIYVSTAKALAEGEGYRLAHLPGAPPQTKYPPLYPALLAVVWKLGPDFPANLPLLKGLSLLCGASALALAYLFLVRFRYASRATALAATLLTGTGSLFLVFAVVTMAELLFASLTIVALWRVELALGRPPSQPSPAAGGGQGGGAFLDGVLLALPYLCRSVGIVFVPAALFLLWRARRPLRWTAAGAAVAMLPWIAWTMTSWMGWGKDPVQGYYTDYFGWWVSLGLPSLARVVLWNGLWTIIGVSSLSMEGVSLLLQWLSSAVWTALFVALGLLVLRELGLLLYRGRALAAFVTAYLLLLVVWPWPPQRFLVPLLPLLAALLLRALGRLLDRLPFSAQSRVAPVAWALLLLANLVAVMGYDPGRAEGRSVAGNQASWAAYDRTFDWLRRHSDPQDVLLAANDPMVYLYTGRRTLYPIVCPPQTLFYGLPAPAGPDPEASLRALERHRPAYVVLMPRAYGEQPFREWVENLRRAAPHRLERVYADPDDPRFEIYRLRYLSERVQRRAE